MCIASSPLGFGRSTQRARGRSRLGQQGIIGLDTWWSSPAGQYLASWEQVVFDALVANVFGYHAMQLGASSIDALRANRMQHRCLVEVADAWGLAAERDSVLAPQAWVHDDALPFAADSLDLVVMPHTLELSSDPHACVREVYRVLRPEGRMVITGFNPWSWWGASQRGRHLTARLPGMKRMGWGQLFLPQEGEFLPLGRVNDWLKLLGMEVAEIERGVYRPATQDERWLQRWARMDDWGERWWPIFGAAYCVVAVKKVPALRLLSPKRRARRAMAARPATATTIGASSMHRDDS